MPDTKSINVKWVTDKYDDDLLYKIKDVTNDIVSSTFSIFGYTDVDKLIQTNDRISFENTIVKTKLGGRSGFSIGATIAILSRKFGKFIIPDDIIEYIQKEIKDKKTYERYMKNLPTSEDQLKKGMILVDEFLKAGYPTQAAYSLAGSAWTECHWDPNIYNSLEQRNNGTGGTGNWSGCGEGLFGLTFWNQKKKIIERMSLHTNTNTMYKWNGNSVNKNEKYQGLISNDENVYNKGPFPSRNNDRNKGCLFQLTEDMWIKIMKVYIENLGTASGDEKPTIDYLMYDGIPNGKDGDKTNDDHKLLYSSYLYKASPGTKKEWEAMLKVINNYKGTHKAQSNRSNFIPINGFVEQLLAAYILSQYCNDVNPKDISLSEIVGDTYGETKGFISRVISTFTNIIYGEPNYDNYDKVDNNDYTVDGTWWDCVQKMGKWYETNVHTYQGTRQKPRSGRKRYMCNLINAYVEDDCSSFIKACLTFFKVPGIEKIHVSTALMQPGSKFDKILRENGFKCIPYSYDKLKVGDIICGGPATHTEIWAGNRKVYSWGNVHDKTGNFQGMPCAFARSINYKHIWRYIG